MRRAAAVLGAWLMIGAAGCDWSGSSDAPQGSAAPVVPVSQQNLSAAATPSGRSLVQMAQAGAGGGASLSDPGRSFFDGDTRGSSFGFGGAVPVSRPSYYSGPYTRGIIPVSDLTVSPPPSPAVASSPQTQGLLMRAAQAVGGDVRVAAAIVSAAVRRGIDPILALAVGTQESGLHNGLRSSAGALGAMQVMPGTACGLGVCNAQAVRYDVTTNAALGTSYLSQMLQRQNGNVALAVASYNAGPGAVHGGIPNNGQTPDYVRKVLGYYQRFYNAVFSGGVSI